MKNSNLKIQSIQLNNYNEIKNAHLCNIQDGLFNIDPYLLKGAIDKRSGLTLLINIGDLIKKYNDLIENFDCFTHQLYLYPQNDLHITLFDIYPAQEHFSIGSEQLDRYIKCFDHIFNTIDPIHILMEGIIFTDAAGFISGFDGLILSKLREILRKQLNDDKLDFQERYSSILAHSTFCRFTDQIKNIPEFISTIKTISNMKFGEIQALKIDLVIHDWLNQEKKTRIIKSFNLS